MISSKSKYPAATDTYNIRVLIQFSGPGWDWPGPYPTLHRNPDPYPALKLKLDQAPQDVRSKVVIKSQNIQTKPGSDIGKTFGSSNLSNRMPYTD